VSTTGRVAAASLRLYAPHKEKRPRFLGAVNLKLALIERPGYYFFFFGAAFFFAGAFFLVAFFIE
jgi:hypothetical protein